MRHSTQHHPVYFDRSIYAIFKKKKMKMKNACEVKDFVDFFLLQAAYDTPSRVLRANYNG